ncbi:MAG: nitrate/nitrite transporter NrtS [Flavobacteriales bacterium]|nr:nitrate/nitrite transporter NrtS [Flavobacteriales bacterium]
MKISVETKDYVQLALSKEILRRALMTSLVVGTVLTTINIYDLVLHHEFEKIQWTKLLLMYIVPYSVSTYSSVKSKITSAHSASPLATELDKPDWENAMTFIKHNPAPVLRISHEGKVTECNPASMEIFSNDLIGLTVSDLIPYLSVDIIQHAIKMGSVQYFTLDIGDSSWSFSVKGVPELNICQIYGADITLMNKYKNDLEALSFFPKLNPAPVIRFDDKGIVLSNNEASKEIFGEDLTGNSIVQYIREIDLEKISEIIQNNQITHATVHIGAKVFDFTIRGVSHLGVCQIYGSDITTIEASKKQLKSVALFAELNPEPVMRFDSQGKIIAANPAAKEVFKPKEIVGEFIKEQLDQLIDTDIDHVIANNLQIKIEQQLGDKVFRFMIRGVKELNVCQTYGSDITKRVEAREIINKQSEKMVASLVAGKGIQKAILPSDAYLDKVLKDYFIIYRPKDVVSGDFFWVREVNDQLIVVAADCTGHGVPGGFMTMLGVSTLNEIVLDPTIDNAAKILNRMRERVKSTLSQSDHSSISKSGMDLSCTIIDRQEQVIQFAGAYNSLFLKSKNKELIEYRGDKMPIGVHRKEKEFTNHIITYQSLDKIYMTSDGYVDQFGGPEHLKLTKRRFVDLIEKNHDSPIKEQGILLDNQYLQWKEGTPQTDDVLVIGIVL